MKATGMEGSFSVATVALSGVDFASDFVSGVELHDNKVKRKRNLIR